MEDIKLILKEVLGKLDSLDKKVDSLDDELKVVRKAVDKHSIIFEDVNKKLSVLGEVQQQHIESEDRKYNELNSGIKDDIGLIKTAVTRNVVDSAERHEEVNLAIDKLQENSDKISEDMEDLKLEFARNVEKTAKNRVDILELKRMKYVK